MTSQIILPQQYDSTSVYDLLRATELGRIGFDLRLLRSLTDRREEALPTLAKWVEEPRHEDRLLDLEEQCFDLFRYFRAAEAVPFYMRLVKGNPAEIPDDLVEAFSELGAPALEAVLQLHSEVDPDDRADIAFLLAAMGVHDDRVKAIFLDTLASDKYEGALCIGLYGDTSLRPLVSESLASLPDNAKEERNALKAAIDELDSVGQREEAPEYDIFSLYPATSAPLFHVLAPEDVLPFLSCDSSEYRAAAAASFCDDAYEDDVRDALMEQATTDDSVEVRAAALRALGERIDDDVVLTLIEKTLGDTSAPEEVRAGALIGLAGAATSALFQREVQAFYDNDETRAAALEAMWRSLDERYKKHFASNLRHDDEEVRSQAIQGVGAFPLGDLAIELVPFFQDETHREESLFAYALAVPGTITPKSANKFFDRIEDRAGGMTESESEVVAVALDRRLEREGYRPHFFPDDEDEHDHDHGHGAAVKHHDQPVRSEKVGRNDPCPCGSGKKYKKCHGAA